jgi:thiol-disulfide isomerase/thioredoxin
MKKFHTILFILLCFMGNTYGQKSFTLSGKTDEVKDGTTLYLYDRLSGDLLDTAVVQDRGFSMKAELTEGPLNALLRTRNYSHYRFIWLEDAPMTFDDSKTDFRTALVTGSESEDLSQSLYSDIDDYNDEEQMRREIAFVKSHPESVVSASILSTYATTWGKEQTQELYDRLAPELLGTEYAKQVSRYLELSKDLNIGDQFEELEIPDQDGNIQKLSHHMGKLTLIEFWASWCGPCRKENPNLVKTYQKYHTKGFEIYAISLDNKRENWLEAIKKDGLTWTQVSDLKGGDADAVLIYNVNAIPDNLLVDENGVIVARGLRGKKLEKQLSEFLD